MPDNTTPHRIICNNRMETIKLWHTNTCALTREGHDTARKTVGPERHQGHRHHTPHWNGHPLFSSFLWRSLFAVPVRGPRRRLSSCDVRHGNEWREATTAPHQAVWSDKHPPLGGGPARPVVSSAFCSRWDAG